LVFSIYVPIYLHTDSLFPLWFTDLAHHVPKEQTSNETGRFMKALRIQRKR